MGCTAGLRNSINKNYLDNKYDAYVKQLKDVGDTLTDRANNMKFDLR
jgi:hypothetical protein